jgi:Plasmid pRiA4b ORF-3-like protein
MNIAKNGTALPNTPDQSTGIEAVSRVPPREFLALKLSPRQRSTVLQYTTLPDHLAIKVGNIAANQFTPDELDELLDHVEGVGRRAKGNDKQKILRIAEKVSNLLGSDIDAAEFSKRRSSKKTDSVFQIKITLRRIDPPIWRRIQTKDCTLEKLHALIQVAMGWEFDHLYRFEIGGVEFADVETDVEEEVQDVRATKISDVIPASHRRPRFYYEYDFGDEWWHQLIVEERLSPQAGVAYPACIAGARACPPEDCGGPFEYADMVEVLQNPSHKRHKDMLEWVGGGFDSETFDLDAVNKQLTKIH